MSKRVAALVWVGLLTTGALADYVAERKAAADLANAGKAEAAAKYQTALENKAIQPWIRDAVEKALKELQGETQK